jgi:hypothetical protein
LSKYDSGMYFRLVYRMFRQRILKKLYPDDEKFLEILYERYTGKKMDVANPKRFTDKMQWLKLNYRDPLMQKCADKYAVREYVKSKGYGDLLNELIAVYDNAKDFNPDELPDKFVVKATHSSAMNLICTDKKSVNWKSKERIFKMWFKINLYLDAREWAYKDIKPRIVVEKYLEDDSGSLRDYKLFCFNGKVGLVEVDEDRYSSHKQAYYTPEWEKVNTTTGCVGCDADKPPKLDEMIKIATDLSTDFPFVRVDLYNCNGKIYFGELTFYDGSGFCAFDPDRYNYYYGDMLALPKNDGLW